VIPVHQEFRGGLAVTALFADKNDLIVGIEFASIAVREIVGGQVDRIGDVPCEKRRGSRTSTMKISSPAAIFAASSSEESVL
jgi:hypothetical protein